MNEILNLDWETPKDVFASVQYKNNPDVKYSAFQLTRETLVSFNVPEWAKGRFILTETSFNSGTFVFVLRNFGAKDEKVHLGHWLVLDEETKYINLVTPYIFEKDFIIVTSDDEDLQ